MNLFKLMKILKPFIILRFQPLMKHLIYCNDKYHNERRRQYQILNMICCMILDIRSCLHQTLETMFSITEDKDNTSYLYKSMNKIKRENKLKTGK